MKIELRNFITNGLMTIEAAEEDLNMLASVFSSVSKQADAEGYHGLSDCYRDCFLHIFDALDAIGFYDRYIFKEENKMKKVVCGALGTIYYATILIDGRMSASDRVNVTNDAIIAVADHLRTVSEQRAGYNLQLGDKSYILALFDVDMYKLVPQE